MKCVFGLQVQAYVNPISHKKGVGKNKCSRTRYRLVLVMRNSREYTCIVNNKFVMFVGKKTKFEKSHTVKKLMPRKEAAGKIL